MSSPAHFLSQQTDAVVGSLVASVGGVVAATHAPLPAEAPWWAPWVMSAVAGALPLILIRVLGAIAAGRDALAKGKRDRAARLLSDADPGNDKDAARLLDEAARHEAEAAALRALRNDPKKDGDA